jgi:hypothetical protein
MILTLLRPGQQDSLSGWIKLLGAVAAMSTATS